MNQAYLFDEYARLIDVGRILDRSHFPLQVASEYDRYLARMRRLIASVKAVEPGLPDVFTEFVGNPSFNAYAAKYKGSYFVAIFDGLPLVVATVVNHMLADSRLFADIGDPEAEEQILVPLAALVVAQCLNAGLWCWNVVFGNWVESFELDSRICGRELPVYFSF